LDTFSNKTKKKQTEIVTTVALPPRSRGEKPVPASGTMTTQDTRTEKNGKQTAGKPGGRAATGHVPAGPTVFWGDAKSHKKYKKENT